MFVNTESLVNVYTCVCATLMSSTNALRVVTSLCIIHNTEVQREMGRGTGSEADREREGE